MGKKKRKRRGKRGEKQLIPPMNGKNKESYTEPDDHINDFDTFSHRRPKPYSTPRQKITLTLPVISKTRFRSSEYPPAIFRPSAFHQ
mmetsp:Transcript_45202/g.57889  ORF Transcript_45202/g.57889 Transcript_45202/m.57889 type:complete len:87 (+) Transcript_45202:308-568(+)